MKILREGRGVVLFFFWMSVIEGGEESASRPRTLKMEKTVNKKPAKFAQILGIIKKNCKQILVQKFQE
jgi:hypothetical protein